MLRGVLANDAQAEKPNMLNDMIIGIPLDAKSGGQFYELRNVRDRQNRFFDFFILVDGGITKRQQIRLLQAWAHKSRGGFVDERLVSKLESSIRQSLLQQMSGRQAEAALEIQKNIRRSLRHTQFVESEFIQKEQIAHLLNGIGRVVEYKAVPGQPNQAQVVSVSEGVFKQGQLHGYARRLNKDGSCGVGFWQVQVSPFSSARRLKDAYSDLDPRPYGKYAEYAPDGSLRKREGIYTANERTGVQLVQECRIKDYLSNYDVDQLVVKAPKAPEKPRFR